MLLLPFLWGVGTHRRLPLCDCRPAACITSCACRSYMKPFIDDNTRKVLMVVIPLQVRHPGLAGLLSLSGVGIGAQAPVVYQAGSCVLHSRGRPELGTQACPVVRYTFVLHGVSSRTNSAACCCSCICGHPECCACTEQQRLAGAALLLVQPQTFMYIQSATCHALWYSSCRTISRATSHLSHKATSCCQFLRCSWHVVCQVLCITKGM